MTTTVAGLAERFGWELIRDADVATFGFVELAGTGRLVYAVRPKYLNAVSAEAGVAAVLTTPSLAPEVPADLGLATTADPARSFVEIHNRLVADGGLYGPWLPTAVDPTATVHPRAHVDDVGVVVGPGCVIGPNATVLQGTELGAGVEVAAGAVLGAEGFQTVRSGAEVLGVRHGGRLVVGDRAAVMANAVVARAVFRDATSVGADVRIGNGAFVSHACQIGARCLVGHGAVVAGNCRVGDDVTIGPGAVCLDRIEIGDGAAVTAGAVVARSVDAGCRVSGNFAVDHQQFLRTLFAARPKRQ